MRVIATRICFLTLIASASALAASIPKTGIRTPGIQIPIVALKPEAEIALTGPADSLFVGDTILVGTKNQLIPIAGKTNKTEEAITAVKQPCATMIAAFGSIWVPSCADKTLSRIDPKTKKVTASIAVPVVNATRAVAASTDSVWVLSDEKSTLARLDPDENKIVAEVRLPSGCNSLLFAETALWVTCASEDKVLRIDPATNLVTKRVDPPNPVSLAFGEGSVWALCKTEGKVARIDPKTNKSTTNIELKTREIGGEIAFGEGFVWVSSPGFPVTRIDPANDKVAQQFTGVGGGRIYVGSGSIWIPDLKANTVSRFDPKRIKATLAE